MDDVADEDIACEPAINGLLTEDFNLDSLPTVGDVPAAGVALAVEVPAAGVAALDILCHKMSDAVVSKDVAGDCVSGNNIDNVELQERLDFELFGTPGSVADTDDALCAPHAKDAVVKDAEQPGPVGGDAIQRPDIVLKIVFPREYYNLFRSHHKGSENWLGFQM